MRGRAGEGWWGWVGAARVALRWDTGKDRSAATCYAHRQAAPLPLAPRAGDSQRARSHFHAPNLLPSIGRPAWPGLADHSRLGDCRTTTAAAARSPVRGVG